MIERIIILDGTDPVTFFGANNSNFQLIKSLYPKLRIVASGNIIRVIGDELELAGFEEKIREMEKYCRDFNLLNEEAIIGLTKRKSDFFNSLQKQENLIIYGI